MSVQKQLLSNKRLWVRLLSLAVIIAIALLKPKFDEWMNKGQADNGNVTQADTQPRKSGDRPSASNTNSDSEPSLDDLLSSVREDADVKDSVNPADFQVTTAPPSKNSGLSGTGKQTTQQSSGNSKANPKGSSGTSSTKDDRSSKDSAAKANPSGANSSKSKPGSSSNDSKAQPRLGKLTLVRGTRDEFRSTAGLMYVPGSADGHRLKHVLKHAEDNLSKPVHGVFDGDRDQILEWIDKAYVMGKKGEKGARKESQRDRTVYTANLNERVGYVGGQKGKRNGNKECRYLRLVLENGAEVVTAYPSDRM